MPEFIRVAGAADVPAGSIKEVQANGKTLALANVNGQFYAIDNVCLHRGGPLGQGFLEGFVVECPWHGWQFDLRTGECVFNPSAKLPTCEVKVEGGEVFVRQSEE